MMKKDYDKALADLGKAIRLGPGDAEAYVVRAAAWSDTKEHDKALKDLGEAIRLDRAAHFDFRVITSLIERSKVWNEKGEHDKEIADLDEAGRLARDPAGVYRFRGYAWLEKNEPDKAITDLNEAVRLGRARPRDLYQSGPRLAPEG